jgi:anti-sigma factor RsiW
MNCTTCQSELSEILFDPTGSRATTLRAHIETCAACHKELASLQATFSLLDSWHAPEPSPYFDQKLAVLLREEIASPPENFFERIKSRLLFNTGRQFRPALVGAMALVLLLGGGTFAGVSLLPDHAAKVQTSAAVDDLQILDKNDQAMQQMDQLLQEDDDAPPLS